MGKTSNAVKYKWNSCHYSQVKISIKPETAAAFKSACIAADDTMAGVLSRYMLTYAGQTHDAPGPVLNVKTLKDRRKTAVMVCDIVTALLNAEEKFINNAPESLISSTRYEMAEERVSILQDVLDAIEEAYST